MARTPKSKKRSSVRPPQFVLKPLGVIGPRIQAVGPKRFGIVSVDCAKVRSKWMLADFYGQILFPPTEVEHTKAGFTLMIQRVRTTLEEAAIRDQVVVIERTGQYHRPVQRAFPRGGFKVRHMHPLTTKHHRQSANPGNKTDDTDLFAIHRAAVNGFGFLEPAPDPGLMKTGGHFRVLGLPNDFEFVALCNRIFSLKPWNGSIAWTRQLGNDRSESIRPHPGFRLGSSVEVAMAGKRNTRS